MNGQQLLDSIRPGMSLNEEFFKRIYGYELTWPGFAEIALTKLEEAGSTKSRKYYEQFSQKYENESKEILRNVSIWYSDQLEKERERIDRKEVRKWKKNVSKMSQKELLNSLESFKDAAL